MAVPGIDVVLVRERIERALVPEIASYNIILDYAAQIIDGMWADERGIHIPMWTDSASAVQRDLACAYYQMDPFDPDIDHEIVVTGWNTCLIRSELRHLAQLEADAPGPDEAAHDGLRTYRGAVETQLFTPRASRDLAFSMCRPRCASGAPSPIYLVKREIDAAADVPETHQLLTGVHDRNRRVRALNERNVAALEQAIDEFERHTILASRPDSDDTPPGLVVGIRNALRRLPGAAFGRVRS